MDHTQQKIIAPTPQGGVAVSNSIPRVVRHTDTGYAFLFENKITKQRLENILCAISNNFQSSIRAFKHFKRSDFNSPALAKKTVDSMSKVGVNWMFITGEIFYIIC